MSLTHNSLSQNLEFEMKNLAHVLKIDNHKVRLRLVSYFYNLIYIKKELIQYPEHNKELESLIDTYLNKSEVPLLKNTHDFEQIVQDVYDYSAKQKKPEVFISFLIKTIKHSIKLDINLYTLLLEMYSHAQPHNQIAVKNQLKILLPKQIFQNFEKYDRQNITDFANTMHKLLPK